MNLSRKKLIERYLIGGYIHIHKIDLISKINRDLARRKLVRKKENVEIVVSVAITLT